MAGKRSTRWIEAVLQADVALNSSSKTFTVPAGKSWVVLAIYAKLLSTATVGNRQMEVKLQRAASHDLFIQRAGINQAASLTRFYMFGPDLGDLTAFRDTDLLTTPLPNGATLPAGFKVLVRDKAAVDAAADDMDVRLLVEELTE